MPILNIKSFNNERNNLTVNNLFLECNGTLLYQPYQTVILELT